MIDYSNCLRPSFTEQIFKKLLDDKSLNPFGVKGISKKRLLDDLETLAKEAGIKTVRIDMKGYANNYASFVKQIEIQIRNSSFIPHGTTPLLMAKKIDEPIKNLPSVSELIKYTKIATQQPVFILLENFDTLIETKVHQFPMDFFLDLNAIKGTPNITLCCTTEKSHKNSQLYFEGGRSQQTSFLDLEPIGMPSLTMVEIRNLLHKKLIANPLWEKEKEKESFIDFISQQKANSLIFIDLLVDDFRYIDSPMESRKQRIARIKKQHKKRYKVKHSWSKIWSFWRIFKREAKDVLPIAQATKDLTK